IDLPISRSLSIGLSFAALNQDGFVKNLGGGPNLSDTDARVGRIVIDYHPNEKFSAIVMADATRRREQARAQKLLRYNPAAPAPTFGPFAALGVGTYDSRFMAGGPFTTNQGQKAYAKSNLDLYGLSLTMKYDFGDFSVKSITAYRTFKSKFGRDSDNSPFTIVETIDVMHHNQFSQEFQVSGLALKDNLKWLLGAFYFHEDGSDKNTVLVPIFNIISGGDANNDSRAVFGQVTYDVTTKMSLTFGARYTAETKRFLPDQYVSFNKYTIPVFGGAGFVNGQRILPYVESSRDFNNFSLMGSLNYNWTDTLMTYLSYSEGYKSGGFNQRVFPPRGKPGSFEPENVSVYEAGWKWTNDADTIRFNGAGFYTDYTNIQVKIIDVIAPGTGNAAKGRIYGGEMELHALLTPELSLQLSAGYLNTRYTAFAANFDPSQGINTNSSFVDSPKWSLSGSLSYVVPVSSYGDISFRGDWSYRSKVYNDAANSEYIAQAGLNLFNAGATFNSADGKWQLALQVRNITNKIYVVTGNDEYNGFGYTEVIYARPREWSLSVKRLF
ncbi:MAG: TonB-dependent receptor, partial [Alphaproteobacteria bacterium]|nr:TonB-dependent receptor [Alphaproteobacteria bacterium]